MTRGRPDFVLVFGAMNVDEAVARIRIRARPNRRATKFATSRSRPLEEALRRAEAERAPQKRFRSAYRFRFSPPRENGRSAF